MQLTMINGCSRKPSSKHKTSNDLCFWNSTHKEIMIRRESMAVINWSLREGYLCRQTTVIITDLKTNFQNLKKSD